jgi:biopolymer transport protein ExbB
MIHHLAAWFNAGGPFMWAILSILAIASAIALERVIFYSLVCRKRGYDLIKAIEPSMEKGDMRLASVSIKKSGHPMYRLALVILENCAASKTLEQIQEALDEAAIMEMPRLPNRLNYLGLFANISTLLGLLGTVVGLQLSFASLASVEAAQKATMLATGISQAMNCTAFGLIVAISCMICYTMLFNKQASLTKELDGTIVRLMNFVKRSKG